MSNQEIGNSFEKKMIEILRACNWWVHKVARNESGQQPCDLIAVKNNNVLLVECKTISNAKNRFSLSRVEANQEMTGIGLAKVGSIQTYVFAFEHSDGSVWLSSARTILEAKIKGDKSITGGEVCIFKSGQLLRPSTEEQTGESEPFATDSELPILNIVPDKD